MFKKSYKNLLSLILALLLVGSQLSPVEAAVKDFPDLKEGWSKQAMEKAIDNGLFVGNDQGLIRPRADITRGELIAVISRILGLSEEADLSSFKDLKKGDWYYSYIAKAYKAEIVKGHSPSKMAANEPIKRQEAFAIMARVFKLEGLEDYKLDFIDTKELSDWARPEVASLIKTGYVEGNHKNQLKPKSNLTREEFATIVARMVEVYGKKDMEGQEIKGNLLINSKINLLKDCHIKGDLIIGEGQGKGDLILDNLKLEGRLVNRSKAKIRKINSLEETTIEDAILEEQKKLEQEEKNYNDLVADYWTEQVAKEELAKAILEEQKKLEQEEDNYIKAYLDHMDRFKLKEKLEELILTLEDREEVKAKEEFTQSLEEAKIVRDKKYPEKEELIGAVEDLIRIRRELARKLANRVLAEEYETRLGKALKDSKLEDLKKLKVEYEEEITDEVKIEIDEKLIKKLYEKLNSYKVDHDEIDKIIKAILDDIESNKGSNYRELKENIQDLIDIAVSYERAASLKKLKSIVDGFDDEVKEVLRGKKAIGQSLGHVDLIELIEKSIERL